MATFQKVMALVLKWAQTGLTIREACIDQLMLTKSDLRSNRGDLSGVLSIGF